MITEDKSTYESWDELHAPRILGKMNADEFVCFVSKLYKRSGYVQAFGDKIHADGRRRSACYLCDKLKLRSYFPVEDWKDWQEKYSGPKWRVYNSLSAARQMHGWLSASGPDEITIMHPGPKNIIIQI